MDRNILKPYNFAHFSMGFQMKNSISYLIEYHTEWSDWERKIRTF